MDRVVLEPRMRGYFDRVLRALSAFESEGFNIRRTGFIKVYVGPQVEADMKAWARILRDEYAVVFDPTPGPHDPQGWIGTLAGLDVLADRELEPSGIRLRYDYVV